MGDWYKGTRAWRLIAEVENSWSELRGTISDLFKIQAKYKWAVLYHDDTEAAANELANAAREVRAAFAKQGFEESPDTKYEVVALKDSIRAPEGLLGTDAVELCFRTRDPLERLIASIVKIG